MKVKFWAAAAAMTCLASVAYGVSGFGHMKEPIQYYAGHSHGPDGDAIGAPGHSGGLDRKGCHNASVPYHCH